MSKEKIGVTENIFGKALREARKSLGLTQGEFANPLSITGGYVSDIEKGKAIPSESVIREISEVYRINRLKLETGEGPMFLIGANAKYFHEEGGYIAAVADMMRAMDEDTQKDIFLSVQKEKLLRELLNERQEKKAG